MSEQATFVYDELELLRNLEDLVRTVNEFGLLRYEQYSDSAYRLIREINECLEELEDLRG